MDVNENRKRFISDLRTNPLGLKQVFNGSIGYEERGEACAVGLGCKTFGFDMHEPFHQFNGKWASAYIKLAEVLGLLKSDLADPSMPNTDDMDFIWQLNDLIGLSFAEIADKCEELWFGSDESRN